MKTYYEINPAPIGKVRHSINVWNDTDKHKDGSVFKGIKCFKSKKAMLEYIKTIGQ